MADRYFLIARDADGGCGVMEVDPREIEKDISEDGGYDPESFLDELPEGSDMQEWPGEYAHLLIKGSIVVPRPGGYRIE